MHNLCVFGGLLVFGGPRLICKQYALCYFALYDYSICWQQNTTRDDVLAAAAMLLHPVLCIHRWLSVVVIMMRLGVATRDTNWF